MITFRFVKESDIEIIAADMRKEDIRELQKCGHSPKEALKHSVSISEICLTAYYKNKPICIFGVVPESLMGQRGIVWLLGSNRINQCKKAYFKACKHCLFWLLKKYPVLWNLTDPEYTKCHKWLKSLGAEFKGTRKVSTGVDFNYFEIRRK